MGAAGVRVRFWGWAAGRGASPGPTGSIACRSSLFGRRFRRFGFEGQGEFIGPRPAFALPNKRQDVSVVKDAIEDSLSDGDVVEELAPVFERPVRGEEDGFFFVAAHDDLQ